jgi:hypothetical protein
MAYKLGISGAEPPDLPKPKAPRAEGDEAEEEEEAEDYEQDAGVEAEMLDAAAASLPVGDELVNHRVRVYWPDDAAWYCARVRKFMRTTGQHLLRYEDDGVEEWAVMSKERFELADGDDDAAAGAAAAAPEALVGRRCRVPWTDRKLYDAVVTDYDAAQGLHRVAYDAEQFEWIDLARRRVTWVDPAPGAGSWDKAQALAVLNAMRAATAPDGRRVAALFELVPSRAELPHYHTVIKQPVAIATMEAKLKRATGGYADAAAFVADGELMFSNAFTFNPHGSEVYHDAKTLRKIFRKGCAAAGFTGGAAEDGGRRKRGFDDLGAAAGAGGSDKRQREEAAEEPLPVLPLQGFKIKLGGLKFKLGGGSVSGNLSAALDGGGSEPSAAAEPAPAAPPAPALEPIPAPEALGQGE